MKKIKHKLLLGGIYLLGALCLIIFIIAHNNKLSNLILHDALNRISKQTSIKPYLTPLPSKIESYEESINNPTIAKADVLTIGDSFFDFSTQKTIPERLSDTLNLKVHYTRGRLPLNILHRKGMQKQEKERVLIFELVERNIPFLIYNDFGKTLPTKNTWGQRLKRKVYALIQTEKEKTYSFLLRNSKWTFNAYSNYATFRYNKFGYTEKKAPHFMHNNEAWLFYYKTTNKEVSSYFYKHSKEEINQYADYLNLLKKELREQYNIRMIFMPIPNKVSIYHHYLSDEPYNQFLPQLYEALNERELEFIELYEAFKNSPETLYFPTDTHWNKKGVDLGMQILLDYFKKNELLISANEKSEWKYE